MFRLCFEKYIIDKKFNGYYLWERVGLFQYTEKLSGVDDLINFFTKDDVNETVEHVLSTQQAKEIAYNTRDKYSSGFKTHINMTSAKIKEDNCDYSYGVYEDFIAEFTKQELGEGWIRRGDHPESFFTENGKSKIHASIYSFYGVYMIMKTLSDFVKVEKFIEENIYEGAFKGKLINKWSI